MKKRVIVSTAVLLIAVITLALISVLTQTLWSLGRNDSELHDKDSQYAISYSESLMDIDIDSPQGFVYSVSDDTIIFTKGEHKVVHPGSTTKLLSTVYALTILSPNEIITPGDELDLVKEGSSIAYINSAHKLSVEMLVEGMLLPSGNDAAYVLAAAAGRKLTNDPTIDGKRAVEAFINGMNAYAKEIGLCGTNFTCPDGYADETHYTTTEDMVIISRLALENNLIVKYASLPKDDVVYASGHTNTWHNTNKLLDPNSVYYNPYVIGLKTGSLDKEYCLVFAFRFEDGREYIAGVFGHDEKNTRYEDALAIIKALEDNQ